MGDSSTQKAITQLEGHLTSSYRDHARSLTNTLESGLKKLDFGTSGRPSELTDIEQLLITIQSEIETDEKEKKESLVGSSHAKLTEQMKDLTDKIHRLRQKVDLNNLQANNFVFQAEHALDGLSWFMVSDYARIAEPFIDSVGKPSAPTEKKKFSISTTALKTGIMESAIDSFTEKYSKGSDLSFITDFYNSFHSAEQSLPKSTPVQKTARITLSESLVSKALAQAGQSKSTQAPPLTSLDARGGMGMVSKGMYQGLHEVGFDAYYTQVVLYMKMISEIDKIVKLRISTSESTPKMREALRSELYAQYGIEELNGNEGKEFLNKIALILGFESTQVLYENHLKIDTGSSENAAKFLNKRKQFFITAQTARYRENDPLFKLEEVCTQEHARIQEKSTSGKKEHSLSYDKNNYVYIANINYVTKVFEPTLNFKRSTAGALEKMSPNAVNTQSEPSLVSSLLLTVANAALPRIVDITKQGINDVVQNTVALEQTLSDTSDALRNTATSLEAIQKEKSIKKQEHYFGEVFEAGKVNLDKVLDHYAAFYTNQQENEARSGAKESEIVEQDYAINFDIASFLYVIEPANLGKNLIEIENQIQSLEKLEKDQESTISIIIPPENSRAQSISPPGQKRSPIERFGERLKEAAQDVKDSTKKVSDKISDGLPATLKAKTSPKDQDTKIRQEMAKRNSQLNKQKKVALEKIKNKMQQQYILQQSALAHSPDALLKQYAEQITTLKNLEKEITIAKNKKPFSAEVFSTKMLEYQKVYYVIQNNLLATQQGLIDKISTLTEAQLKQLVIENKRLLDLNNTTNSLSLEIPLVDTTTVRYYAYKGILSENGKKIAQESKPYIDAFDQIHQNELVEKYKAKLENERSGLNQIYDSPSDLVLQINDYLNFNKQPKELTEASLDKYHQYLSDKIIHILSDKKNSMDIETLESLYQFTYNQSILAPNIKLYPDLLQRIDGLMISVETNEKQYKSLLKNSTQFLLDNREGYLKAKFLLEAKKYPWLWKTAVYFNISTDFENDLKYQQALFTNILKRNRGFIESYQNMYSENTTSPTSQDLVAMMVQLHKLKTNDYLKALDLDPEIKASHDQMIQAHEKLFKQVFSQSDGNTKVAFLEEAIKFSVTNNDSTMLIWLLSNTTLSLNNELAERILESYSPNTATNRSYSPLELGKSFLAAGVRFVNRDKVEELLVKIRQAFKLQEFLESQLRKEIPQDDDLISQKMEMIIKNREAMVSSLIIEAESKARDVSNFDPQGKVQVELEKWSKIVSQPIKTIKKSESETIGTPAPVLFTTSKDQHASQGVTIHTSTPTSEPDSGKKPQKPSPRKSD